MHEGEEYKTRAMIHEAGARFIYDNASCPKDWVLDRCDRRSLSANITFNASEPSSTDLFNDDMSITYRQYAGETDMQAIMTLVQFELSEPYVVYTYRYFLDSW